MNNILYLKASRGLGNIIMNTLLILIWIVETRSYDKLVIAMHRPDSIPLYCKSINNKYLEFQYEPTEKTIKIPTLKTFLKNNYWKSISKSLDNMFIKKLKWDTRIVIYNRVPKYNNLLKYKDYINYFHIYCLNMIY